MAIPVGKSGVSRESYLRQEDQATTKHEFHAGEVLAMSGGTYEHSRIIMNAGATVFAKLKGSKCFPLESNMRVRIDAEDMYVYPDLQVVCGTPIFDPNDLKRTTIKNPRVVFEVISDSTEAYDRGSKFTAYRSLDSLQEYVLISQREPLVEVFRRQPEGLWLFAAYRGLETTASLASINVDLELAEIYTGIAFGDGDPGTTVG